MAKTKKKKKSSKKEQQPNYLAQAMDIALTIAVAAGLLYTGYRVVAGGVKIDQGFTEGSGAVVSVPEETTEEQPAFQSIETSNAVVHEGALILVNNYYALEEDGKDLVSLYDVKMERESHSFSVRDGELQVKQEMADAVISMLDDFYEETYDDNILVISGYRTQEQQQSLYDQYENHEEGEETEQRAAKPGYSEHQTGYGVDLSLYDGSDYDGTGIYSWIDEHCADYGLILRYPDGKTDQTEIMYEPWHYRYVGVPHASVIMEKGMCLEEYLDYVKEFSFEGEHLMASDASGKSYEIYYYPADSNQENTLVPVPSGVENYTIEGNNVDGFIVTIETGEASAAPAEDDTENSEAEDEASSEAPAESSEDVSEADPENVPDAEEAQAAENE